MVRVLVVLRGGYPWGFRMQGGGERPLIVSKVTSTGKAGGAGVRAGCAVKAINGTPTAQLSLSHAHALTKQGSTLTLEIDDNSEEPPVACLSSSNSICSSASASTSSTVVAANGHISSSTSSSSRRRAADSSSCSERTRDSKPEEPISDPEKSEDSDTSVIILETYGADPNILRNDEEDQDSTDSGTEATQHSSPAASDSSLNLSNVSGVSTLRLSPVDSRDSTESDDGNYTDPGSQTDTSTDTLVADVTQYQRDLSEPQEAYVEYDLATGAFIEFPDTQATHTEYDRPGVVIEYPGAQVTYREYDETSGAYIEYPGTHVTYREYDHSSGGFREYLSSEETLYEKDQTTGTLIDCPHEGTDDEGLLRSPTFEDLSSFGENGDSFFFNFEEELERVERQYPNLQVEHLLPGHECEEQEEEEEEEFLDVPRWVLEAVQENNRCATIAEEDEEEEAVAVPRGKLETTMGQYYSSASGEGPSRGEMSGSLPSSPRSSEEWRMSMASTATVASTATADSDDTLAKDMSELSSVNSRLSCLDELQDEMKNPPSTPSAVDPNATPKGTPQANHKRQTSIKDAIDELESIEQAAQTLLQNRQFSGDEDRATPLPPSDIQIINSTSVTVTNVVVAERLSPQSRRRVSPTPPEAVLGKNKTLPSSDTLDKDKTNTGSSEEQLDKNIVFAKTDPETPTTEIHTASPEHVAVNGDSTTKATKEEQVTESRSEVKPPLPPTATSQPPKLEVKRRWWPRSKELQPYISRESYNDDRVLKELERLRRSYQESDLNDFLDALENTAISDDIEEAFLRQLLADISEDVEAVSQEAEDSAQLSEETQVATPESVAQVADEAPAEPPRPSPATSKFEKVKERILEMITVRKAGRVIDTGNCDTPSSPREDSKSLTEDSGRSETPQISRSVTPQSLRADTPDSKSSRPQTPDVTKGEEGKKSFNITQFLKKGSPKYLRKKYKERKNRKSDVLTTSESESEDPDGGKRDVGYGNNNSQRKVLLTESQSSLKGSNRSLNSSQELKKEVRFDLDADSQRKGLVGSNGRDARVDSTAPVIVEEKLKDSHRYSGPQMITCEAQQQETVILKEFEETTQDLESDTSFTLPSTVEDINNRAETLLPRLPERVRPPRKKKKVIPAPVEELSGDLSDNSTSTVASNGSLKAVESKSESLKVNVADKEESPPPLPPYEEILELPRTTPKLVEVVEKERCEERASEMREESVAVTVTEESAATIVASPPSMSVSSSTLTTPSCDTTVICSSTVAPPPPPRTATVVTSSTAEATAVVKDSTVSTSVAIPSAPPSIPPLPSPSSLSTSPVEAEVLVSPLPVTSVASISVAPSPESATLLVYPARTLPLPVIPESLQEDQVSLPTPSEPTVSFSSHGGSAPTTPQAGEDNLPSLYDNVNPFKEMLELENKLLEDVSPQPAAETTTTVRVEPEKTRVETCEVSQPPRGEIKSDHFSLPQEARKSPDLEKNEVVDLDALAALTAEMFGFTNEIDKKLTKHENKSHENSKAPAPEVSVVSDASTSESKSEGVKEKVTDTSAPSPEEAATLTTHSHRPPHEPPVRKETKEIVTQTEPEIPPRSLSVKEIAKSNTIAIQTDATRYVRMYEAASQTDTEYETDLETESEMEESATTKYDPGKWLFRPTRENKVPLPTPKDPQMQELHKQQQAMIQELQKQSVMQERRDKEKPEAPPRQFQDKMPLKVVSELKNVLSEADEARSKLRKVADSPPRWDADLTWDNALQELGLDESTLLSEIEQILGFGSLSSSKNRTEKANDSSTSRPETFEKPVKLEKPGLKRPDNKPLVPERDSSKGVWSPGRSGDEKERTGPSKIDLPDLPSFKDQPSVWSPSRAGSASPSLGRKEYRKVNYDGQTTPQRRPSQENVSAPRPEESFAWKDTNVERVARSPTSTLPKVQNPTVTLLQKKRDDPHSTSEGQIPGKRPEYLKPDDTGPKYKPDDKLYIIKREYESEDEEGGRRFAVLGPKKVQGVGPTTTDGVPTSLKSKTGNSGDFRSVGYDQERYRELPSYTGRVGIFDNTAGVKSEHQGEWYRRMFDSLHKVKDDDHIIIKYKVPRARYGGYMSEPEGYDSDVGSSRYATLDRRRQHHFEVDPMTASLPRNTNRYVHQPGRIEDYVPGYSSLSEKELKKNPEADIKLESQTQEPPAVSVNHRYGSQKMSMTHALKESGYESDSTLVFRKREDARRQAPDPRKTSQVYRQIQRGGDIPLTGLQKANPPKPRESPYKYESGEVNIHYRTPVRIEQKEAIPEEELARRQEEHMKKVYENERRKKYLAELEDIERRRHTDNFTPLQKSPIPLNRYDDESSLGTLRGARTPDLKQVAKALYNFTAQNKRELSFNKGEIIFIRRQIDKNWFEGELRGSVGIFPCNYVEIVPYENIKTLTRKPTEGQARARFNFQAQTSMEMSLSKGELVVLTRRVDENWYEGRIGNRKGIFPVSYVDTLVEPGSDRPMTPSSSPMPRPALPAANLLYNGASSYSSPYSTLGRPGSQNDSRPYNQSLTVNTQQEPVAYRALYNYKPQNDDELELLESDVVMVMEKCDDGWFVGTSRRTGLFGTFPGNYVERV